MKLTLRLKWIVISTLLGLYVTGVAFWVMSHWFMVNIGFGPERSPIATLWLQLHSTVGLWFMVLFGYLFQAHVMPSWKKGKRLRSGTTLTAVSIFLIATVPGLFYISNETMKANVAWVHTYVGLATLVIFLIHYFSKKT